MPDHVKEVLGRSAKQCQYLLDETERACLLKATHICRVYNISHHLSSVVDRGFIMRCETGVRKSWLPSHVMLELFHKALHPLEMLCKQDQNKSRMFPTELHPLKSQGSGRLVMVLMVQRGFHFKTRHASKQI